MAQIRVVIPVFNGEKYIASAIESVLAQTYSDYEVLIADDGSSDSTPSIVTRYAKADGRITYLRLPHGGVSSARNSAIDAVGSYEYLAFLDADDFWDPTHLERGISALNRLMDVDVYFSGIKVDASESSWNEERVSAYERIVSSPSKNFDEKFPGGIYLIRGALCRKELVLGTLWLMPSTVIMKRSAVSRSPWFRTDLVVSEDTEFFLSIAAQKKNFVFDENPSVIYRRHVSNASASGDVLEEKSVNSLLAALRFSKIRLSMCDGPEEFCCVRTQASDAAYLLALNYASRNENATARKYYFESIQQKLTWKVVKGMIMTMLPSTIVLKIRKWRENRVSH